MQPATKTADTTNNEKEKRVNAIVGRMLCTAVAVLLYGWINFLLNPVGTILSGQVAGKQFEPSDMSYITSVVGMRLFRGFGIPFIVLLAVLVLIWWKYIKMGWREIMAVAVAFALITGSVTQVFAYYAQQDYPEIIYILPNQSAFWVPDVGDNKTSQKQFMSEEYLKDQKIAAKRFQIPHAQLPKSSWTKDYYVPSGRLIIVDRTPQAREWVDAHDRGTATHKQGFPCQSSEGLNMAVGISIGVSVMEENSPRFLYRFGVWQDPKADLSKPEVQFQSIHYGRGLSEITDSVVRRKAQTLICSEVSRRNFETANKEMPQIMSAAETGMRTYLKDVGVTLDFIGWADAINFDKVVQDAVNDAFKAKTLASHVDTLERLAMLETKLKWNGQLPWWMPAGLQELLGNLFGKSGVSRAPEAAPTKK